MLGAAVGTTIAASLSPGVALGAVWWGMVGGGFPDWLDLRSDFQRHLKHRGFSHSVACGAMVTLAFWFLLAVVIAYAQPDRLTMGDQQAWVTAYGLGYISHILADACTRGGVQPWLPLSRQRWWLLPRFARGTSDGRIDLVARAMAMVVIVLAAAEHFRSYLA